MYNYHGEPEWEQPQMPFGFNNGNPAGFSAMPASPPFTPPPGWGGTESSSSSRRNDFKRIPEMKNCWKTYALDALQNTWFQTQIVNGNPHKRTPLTNGFSILQIVVINDPVTGSVRTAEVSYCTDATYAARIPADDYINERFLKHFDHVHRLPGCTKSQANDLIGFLIAKAPTITLTVFPHQGINQLADGSIVFATNPNIPQIPQDVVSESQRVRPPLSDINTLMPLEQFWRVVDALHPVIQLLLLHRIGSLLLFWFEPIQVRPYSLLIYTPSASVSEEQLRALLSTNDTQLHRIPSIESSRNVLLKELNLVWDGIAVFTDSSLADESNKVEEPLRILIKEAGGDTGNGRNSIALISRFAPYTAQRIAAENVLSVSMEGVTLDLDCGTIRQIVQILDTVVIQTMLHIPEHERNKFLGECRALPPNWQQFFDRPVSDFAPFFKSAENFLRDFRQHSLLSDNELNEQLNAIFQASHSAVSADQIMIQDFATVLSEKIRNGEIAAVQKQQKVRINPEQDAILIDGDSFYIRGELIDNILRSTQTVHMRNSLLVALRQSNLMHTTDGNTKPTQVYDLNGKSQRLYWYCMDASILDADVLHLIRNLDSEPFWLAPDEVPEHDFVPLLRDESGRIAGKLIRHQDADNGHFYITGQSGAGKTFLLCLLMAAVRLLSHNAVVFDNNDSFTEEAMKWNLSKEFVKANVTFIDINSKKIPIDLFRIDRKAKLTAQKTALVDILTAGIGELSAPQKNTLRSALSEMLKLLNPDEPIRTGDILAMLDEEGATYESLRSRLEPLFEDIDELGMEDQTWDELFKQNKGKIIVIRTASSRSKHGDQLIDMLLESLFKYQRNVPAIPLNLFIDELQNQNFSEGSPIRAILKEGRRYHIALYGATQDYYPRNSELGSSMGKSGTQVFLQPTQNSENAVASELRFKKNEAARFDLMQRGDAIIKGNFYSKIEQRNLPCTLSGQVVPYADNDTESKTETEADNATETDANTDNSEH